MRIGLIASPFISVPPARYGGTELFIANLAEGLERKGIEAVVYCNGESRVKAEKRAYYPRAEWPLATETSGMLKELDHVSWSIEDAAETCDLIHINSAPAITYSRYVPTPFVCTLHHPYEVALARMYERYPEIHYTAISEHQASVHPTLAVTTIHHGIDMTQYRLQTRKEDYLCFLGRIAPIKGVHTAIEVAKRAGIRLKIAGEIQPIFQRLFRHDDKTAHRWALHRICGTGGSEDEEQTAWRLPWYALSHPVGRTLRPGDARGHGLWDARFCVSRWFGARNRSARGVWRHQFLGGRDGGCG